MTSWKKIITSGSSAELSSLIIENVPSASTGQSVLTYDVNSGRIYKTGSYGGVGDVTSASYASSSTSASYASSSTSSSYATTASFLDTPVLSASYASSSTSASYAFTAVSGGSATDEFYVNNNCFISGALTVSGNFSPAGGVTITDTAVDNFTSNTTYEGTVNIAGITKLGTSSANTVKHEITGNLELSGSTGITVNVTTQPGFIGTASWAQSASHTINSNDSVSASYASSSTSASYASSSTSASYASSSTSASYASSSTSASYASSSTSASYALTASHASNASLPTDPTFTTLTTTGTTNLAGPLTVENGSTFNSGVTVEGDLTIRELKISSSATKTFFINESSVDIQGGVESIVEFGPKPLAENSSIINIAALSEYTKGLRFTETDSHIVASIESEKYGIITISGSGHLDAGQVNFEGKRVKFECPITASSLITEGTLNAAAGITATSVTTVGGVNCSNLMVLAGSSPAATFMGDISVTTLNSGETLSIAASTGDITSSGHLKIGESITCKRVIANKGFTGSLLGTSSFAVSSSHTYLAFFASHSFNSATALSASYASSSTSASWANYSETSLNAFYAVSASHLDGEVLSASYASSSTSASYASSSTSASYASSSTSSTSASYASSSTTASYAGISAQVQTHNIDDLLGPDMTWDFDIPVAGNFNTTDIEYPFIAPNLQYNNGTQLLTATSSHAQSSSHATTASFALNAEGGGLWFDGTTYWSSSLQGNGDVTKIGIGRQPTNYSLEVNGTMAATQDVIAFMGSDERLKDNIKPIEDPINKIKQIGGYTFDWNNNQNVYQGSDVGVIAQEIEKVLPSLVQDREDGYKGVKYDKIVALLIEAIKDQQKQIDELKKLI